MMTQSLYKSKRLLSGLLLSLLSLISFSSAQAKSILVLGDSISAAYGMEIEQGWVSLLEQRLEQKFPGEHEVINSSMSGETAAGALSRLPNLLESHQPDILIIELGGNDGLRGQAPALIERNLTRLVVMGLEAGAETLLFGMKIPPNYGTAYSQAFEDNFKRIAESNDIPLLPFFMEDVAGDDGLMQADGIHPKAEAQSKLLDNAWPLIEATLQEE
ncbi:MAG: arylesterase [Alcaligenaceae bacterium]|nr:arylesterase [Alcaligenaceae bacterium]